ncbi:hypothetical protein ABVT39_021378 [Epinephelus coioides]
MACGESGGNKNLLCLGILVVASSFCHCTRLTRLKALDRLRGNSTLSKGQAEGGDLRHGRLLIGQNSLQADDLKGTKATENVLDVDTDYQEDMGWGEPKQPKGQVSGVSRPHSETDSAVVERLLRMEPQVECTGDSMKLQVQDAASTCGSLFFVDRGSRMSPLPLSKLPSSCGYTIKSTRRDLVLVAPYNGCFVALEEDSYILPLRWCGLPVRMSCPLKRQSSPNPPMVTCHAEGMVVKTTWTVSVADLNLKLNGNWEPLMKASPRCGFSVVVHPEGVVISVRYAPCLEKKDGMYTLELAGDGETQISCPSLSPAQTEQPKKPGKVEHPSTPSLKNPAQSVLQVPKIPEAPSKKPNQEPKHVYQPPLPSYPNFFYPFPGKPNTNPAPTVQPSPQTVPPAKGQVPQPFIPSPFYPWPAQPEVPVAREGKDNPTIDPKPPEPEAPQGQVKQPFYPQPKPEKPTAAPKPEPEAPQGQVQQPFYPYPFPFYPQPEKPTTAPKSPQPEAPQGQVQQPFYPQPEPEKPTAAPRPPQPEAPQGQVQQPFYPYPFYPQPEPEKPTAAPKPPQPEAPQGQVQQPFYPQPEPEKPTAAPKPPQPEAPQGQVQQPFYPYPFVLQPEKPTTAPKPPQPEAPWGQVQQPFYPYPFYPQPEPEKPTAAPKPPKPEAPQGQVQQPFYPYPFPFYPQPEKPTTAPKPPQPEAPQGQVQQPFYPQPEPEKPTAAPKPEPEAPQGQVHKPFYPYPFPFYPQPEPEMPTATPKPTQPEAPQGQVQQPFYPWPEPEKPTAAPEPEKSSAAPKPPQPEAPQGQVQQPFYPYPFPFYPQPEKPTTAPKPPQPEAPRGQVQQPFYPQPEPEKPTAAPKPEPEAPQGQVHKPFYPYPFPFYPQPEPEKPTATPKPPQPEAPQGQVQQPFYPWPEPEKPTAAPEPEKSSAAPKPPQPEAPQGQVQQPFYPFPFYPQPEKSSAAPKPPQPEAPQGQVQQPFYPQPEPEKPTAASKPPQPEAPRGQVQQPFYPYPFPFYPQPEKPTTAPKPPQPEAPRGQVQQPFYPQPEPEKPTGAPKPEPEAPQGQVQQPFYPFYLQPAPAVPKPPATETPKGQEQKPAYPQDPQPETPYMPPVYCPQFCPPGFSNCCPQIAFHQHQHLHQIVPAGIGSENAPLHYPLLPFLPSKVYNGFGNGLSSAPPSQMPTKATTTSTSALTSSQSLPYGNEKQPPDGNPAVLNILSMPNNPEQPIYPYIVPNSLYPNWPYLMQNSPQHQSPAHYNMPSKPQTPGSEPVNPLLQYEPHNLQPPKQQNGQLRTSFMPYNGQYLQQQQNQLTAKELQPSNQNPSDSKEPVPPKVQGELDPFLIPYYMLQDDQSKTQDKSTTPNPLQPSWSASRKSPKPEQKSYVLLQHGPPGREPNRLNESPLHFRYPAGDADFLAQNPARQHRGKPQHPENSKPPHEKPQHPKQPGKEISSPFPNVNYMPRSGDNSDVPFYSLNGPHFAPLPQDPSVSTTHLNPKFKGFWRPVTPLGSGQRIQPLVPGKSFKRRSSTADDQAKGLNKPIEGEKLEIGSHNELPSM